MSIEVTLGFKWYDFWIGVYYDKKNKTLYICPLPMIVFTIKRKEREE